jgi:3-oxoacyl-[acyl-carrier protein] reductase
MWTAGGPRCKSIDLRSTLIAIHCGMDFNLKDHVVFIAGSSRGIGRAIAEALLGEDACVVLTGRDESSLDNTLHDLTSVKKENRILGVSGDLCDSAVLVSAFERTVRHFGRIDHLVANLGSGKGSLGWEQPEDEWRRVFEQNFFASVRLTQEALPHLLRNDNGGSILYISSIVGIEAGVAPLPYSAAKAALINYSKNLARQMGPRNVRVNTIAPGNILFPGGTWEKRMRSHSDDVKKMLDEQVPQKRFGKPEEIASLAAYLCSAQAAFSTGACYVMDGGQTRTI